MMLYYDLHIHTALSPCASDEMTPNNIINMALIKGLDVIGITDHNSARNVKAVYNLGLKKRLNSSAWYRGTDKRRGSHTLLFLFSR